jgi:hypothetical protein
MHLILLPAPTEGGGAGEMQGRAVQRAGCCGDGNCDCCAKRVLERVVMVSTGRVMMVVAIETGPMRCLHVPALQQHHALMLFQLVSCNQTDQSQGYG